MRVIPRAISSLASGLFFATTLSLFSQSTLRNQHSLLFAIVLGGGFMLLFSVVSFLIIPSILNKIKNLGKASAFILLICCFGVGIVILEATLYPHFPPNNLMAFISIPGTGMDKNREIQIAEVKNGNQFLDIGNFQFMKGCRPLKNYPIICKGVSVIKYVNETSDETIAPINILLFDQTRSDYISSTLDIENSFISFNNIYQNRSILFMVLWIDHRLIRLMVGFSLSVFVFCMLLLTSLFDNFDALKNPVIAHIVKSTTKDIKYFVILFLGAALVIARIYLYPGALSCYYRFNDCDFCYVMSAVRLLSGLPISYLDHPGYPFSQLLAAFYNILAGLHVFSLPEVSYESLVNSHNLFGYLQILVWSGWVFNSLLFFINGLIVYKFVSYFSSSRIIGLFAGIVSYLSYSTYQFIYKIRPELLSMLLGLISLYLLIRSMDMLEDNRWFVLTFISSIVFFVQATLTKILLIPLCFFLLISIVFMKGMAFAKISKLMLIRLVLFVVFLFPSTYALFYWGLQYIFNSKIFLVRLIPLFFVITPMLIALFRYWKHVSIKLQSGWLRIILKNSLFFFLLFSAGLEISVQVSLFPSLFWMKNVTGILSSENIFYNTMSAYRAYTNFDLFVQYAPSLNSRMIYSSVWQSIDWHFLQLSLSYLVSNLWLEISFITITYILLWRKYTTQLIASLYFIALGILLINFSSLRNIEQQYQLYADVPIIISVGICMGCLLTEIRKPDINFQKRFIQTPLLTIVILGMLVFRLIPLINISSQLACPHKYGNSLEGNLVCLCDAYGGSIGLKDIVENRTGLSCQDAIIKEFNLNH